MIHDIRTVFILALVAACIAAAGCTGNQGNGAMTTVSPAVTMNTTPGDQSGLTNQDSPQAAIFRDGASHTSLVPHQLNISLDTVAGGFSSPMMIALPGDGSGRMAVVDQIGIVRMITPDKKVMDEPFLDVRDRMVKLSSAYDERGLLSLAFHPDFRNNGRVFCLLYTSPSP